MADDLWLDDRLPPLVEITEPTRQQRRRVARTKTPCGKCYQPLTAEDVCFADGRDCHRSCAESWNYHIFDGYETLKAQDEAQSLAEAAKRGTGLILPDDPEDGGLWTPPTRTPAVSTTA